MEKESRQRILRTPKHKIPIGEVVKKPDGNYSVRIKKPGGREIEEVALDQLLTMIMKQAD